MRSSGFLENNKINLFPGGPKNATILSLNIECQGIL